MGFNSAFKVLIVGTIAVTASRISLSQPTFKHPQPTFLPHCERPSFTPIQKNRL